MQRLFSIFPASGPGVALVLMRGCVAAMFAADAWMRFPVGSGGLAAGVCALSALLALGLLTPLACVACLMCEIVFGLHHPSLLGAFAVVEALALALLGPGAYSLDGLLFGRRRLVWPRNS